MQHTSAIIAICHSTSRVRMKFSLPRWRFRKHPYTQQLACEFRSYAYTHSSKINATPVKSSVCNGDAAAPQRDDERETKRMRDFAVPAYGVIMLSCACTLAGIYIYAYVYVRRSREEVRSKPSGPVYWSRGNSVCAQVGCARPGVITHRQGRLQPVDGRQQDDVL